MNADPLVRVTPAELGAVWPKIRDRIEAVRARRREAWLAEHVFHEIMAGGAYLWTTPDLRGFVVLQVLAAPYARDLHVWIAWNDTEARAGDYLDQLKALAADNGCQEITFESERNGWLKALPGVRLRQRFSVAVGD